MSLPILEFSTKYNDPSFVQIKKVILGNYNFTSLRQPCNFSNSYFLLFFALHIHTEDIKTMKEHTRKKSRKQDRAKQTEYFLIY